MTRRAWAYIIAIMLLAGTLYLTASTATPTFDDWVTLCILGVLATVAQFAKVLFWSKDASGKTSTSYSLMLIVFYAGMLLLPPAAFGLLIVIPHAVEWIKERYFRTGNLPAWYIQPFNIATHVVCGIVAQYAYLAFAPRFPQFTFPGLLVALTLSGVTYVVLNHALIGWALVLARGLTWRQSGVLDNENLLSDFMLILQGGSAALLWSISPWLILFVMPPLVMIQRALKVPQLWREARIDPRTKLWNARYFEELFTGEFDRAKRFHRPLTVLMADLDLLREVNNVYGHLAGDWVLQGLGRLILNAIREYDIAARLGGEEFAIVLPEAEQGYALEIAERLRMQIASHAFETPTAGQLHVTISIGVACFPQDADTGLALMKAADEALYAAKRAGRNRAVLSDAVIKGIA